MFFFCVALATADFNNFKTILAAAFFVKERMFRASSDLLPRIRSATNLAFLGPKRANLNLALTSISLPFFSCSLFCYDFSLSVSGMAMEGPGWGEFP